MPLTGDFQRLAATIRGVRKLALVPAATAAAGSVAIKAEIDASFDQQRDPYGKAWQPHAPATVKRYGAHKLLQLTGSGKAAITVKPMAGAGISVVSPSEGLQFAQGGTKNEPVRKFLPTDRLPKTWRAALEKAATKASEEAFRGAR
jgi:hypothetical protein